jgi:hypothetical protein
MVLRGIQRRFKNPYAGSGNLTVQYRRSNSDLIQLSYIATVGHHLLINPGLNEVNELLPPNQQRQAYEPFLNFAYGSSYLTTSGNSIYKSGQVQYVRNFGHGLSFLANGTYATTWTDALDFFNVLNPQTYRAPYIQSFGVKGEYQQADFNVRSAVHFSGGYDLPFGRGGTSPSKGSAPVPKNDWLHLPGLPHLPRPHIGMPSGGLKSRILGGWTLNWVLTVETGQPVTIPCTITTAPGAGCDAPYVSGANPIAGAHNVNQYWNPAAFYNPAVTASTGQSALTPLGGAGTQVYSPDLRRLDAALRRSFQITEHVRAEFRGEVYNVLNHPFFAQPSNLNFLDNTNFGRISSTRDNPNDAREIQFAVKFYF